MKKYEYIEHTADSGIRVFGKNLESLFKHAAEGLFDIITDRGTLKDTKRICIEVEADSLEDLFMKWLRELLYQFDTTGFMPKTIRIKTLSEKILKAELCGDTFNPSLHPFNGEVKAITYHNLRIEKGTTGWEAEVIFDR